MTQLPSKELLESTHQFPSPYVFKVIGKADEGFLGRAVAAVREAVGSNEDPEFSVRQSSGGRHLSVTLTVQAIDADQVRSIYSKLSGLEGLVLLM